MNQLLQIGFVPCGHWIVVGPRLACDLSRFATLPNILYAFVVDGELMYVGKTIQPLAARMAGYRNPAPSQTTNVRNNARIKQALDNGATVEIFALPDTGLHRYGEFHLNLAAGLEDSIIRVMRPPWNGGEKERPEIAAPATADKVELRVQSSFEITLGPTYHRKGFFNIPAAQADLFGSDGETIELYLGGAAVPVLATINRRANANQTPRIMGGVELRDWFRRAGEEGDSLRLDLLSANSVRLVLAHRR